MMVSGSAAVVEYIGGSNAKRPWSRFALQGLVGGMTLGGICAGTEYLLRGRNLHEVAWTTYLLIYPLVGLVLADIGYRNQHAWRWVRPPDFFSVEPLPPEEAAERGRRTRKFVWIGFGVGIAIALVATALDFAWRGWPFLAGTFVGGLLFYPYFGMLLGFNLSLRPGAAKPSIRNFRFRMGTLMILVAYFGIVCGLGTVASRYSGLALQYHMKALNARTMLDVFQGLADGSRADLKRADNAKELRTGRIPDGILPVQRNFLKGLEGNASAEYKKYRYGIIADGEDRLATLASQNLLEFTDRIATYKRLAEKYTKAAQQPWVPVEPDPPMP
jgi:hypothetical protein